MTDSISQDFAGAAGVDTNQRTTAPEFGSHPVCEMISMRHVNQMAGPAVLFTYNIEGRVRGHRTSLKKIPGYAVNYGVRDVKIAIGALNGWGAEDPRTKAIDEATIRRYVGPENEGAGKLFTMEARQGKANPKRPGEFYVNADLYPAKAGAVVGTKASAADVAAALADEGTAHPAPPPPAPATVAQVAWFPLPADHGARAAGKTEYNAAGDVR